MIRFDLASPAIGGGSPFKVAQILPCQAEIEPDRGGSVLSGGALQGGDRAGRIAIFPGQPAEPGSLLLMPRNDLQDRAPGLARLWLQTGLVQGARLLQKRLALRRQRDRPGEMRKGGLERIAR